MEGFGLNSDLVGALYDAASGDGSFQPLAPKIAAAFNSGSCILHVRNGFAGRIEQLSVTPNYTPDVLAKYDAYYYQHDVWANLGLRYPPGVIMGSDDLPMSQAEYRETLIYRDQGRFTNSYYVLGAIVPVGGSDGAFGVFGIHRGETEPMFSQEDKQQGKRLLPHLKRALQLRERLGRLETERHAMLQAMEIFALGVLLVAEDGRVLFTNRAAEEILRRGHGIREHEKRLRAENSAADAELQHHIRNAAQACLGRAAGTGGLLRISCAGAAPLSLSIYPFLAPLLSTGGKMPAALIFVSDLDRQATPGQDVLAQMYRLTGAEARLFEALLAGERLQDYADRCSLSLQTVKTQLRRLFDKTGHARQTDLVRDALRNPFLGLIKR